MASTELVKDVLWRVSLILQDHNPQYQKWSERELVHWLNDAQVAITKFLPSACSRYISRRLRPGSKQSIDTIAPADYRDENGGTPSQPLYGTLLIDVPRNMGANGQTPGRVVRLVDRKTLDSQTENWHTITGTEVTNFTFDPRAPKDFYVTPAVPASPAVWVEMVLTAQPLKIPAGGPPGSPIYHVGGASTQTITISDEYLDDLVHYVVARAHMKEAEFGDPAKAVAYTQMFTGSLNAKVTAITGVNPNLQRLPLAVEPLGAAS
jgi:hypothetical protein